jgi:hypothetical protein
MTRARGVRPLAAQAVALAVFAVGSCTSEEPEGCEPATRGEARTASEAFLEKNATEAGYRDGITGHGLSENDQGWFILVTVSPGEMDSVVRPHCFEGVPIEYATGGPFSGN